MPKDGDVLSPMFIIKPKTVIIDKPFPYTAKEDLHYVVDSEKLLDANKFINQHIDEFRRINTIITYADTLR
eukprot:scaffold803_cov310-Pinguiococcus_pyrenoidosus.AAC.177